MAASPAMTQNAQGNVSASAALAAAGTVTSTTQNWSTKFEAQISVKNTGGGTVAATNGVQIDVFRAVDTTPDVDTTSIFTMILPTVVSTTKFASFTLGTGRYQIKLTNLDAANAVTAAITADTVDSVG